MMREGNNTIVDRSGPRIKTTATVSMGQQDYSGKYATVGQRSCEKRGRRRGGQRAKKKKEKASVVEVHVRVGTLNVGTMTGKGREIADMMERRRIDILCIQETRWKGSKARELGGGYKLYYHGEERVKNGVGVVVKGEHTSGVLGVKRVTDRMICVKMEVKGKVLNIVSAYAPQVGCDKEEKEKFWERMDQLVEEIPRDEKVVIGADFNGHVGKGNQGDERIMGKFGYSARNEEGQAIIEFAHRMDIAILNTYYKKRDSHIVTYTSGGRGTQIDYIMCRRVDLKDVKDCKVVPGESVAKQHHIVISKLKWLCKARRRREKAKPRIRWWKIREEEFSTMFRQDISLRVNWECASWDNVANAIRETAGKVLGMTTGKKLEGKETWWWNDQVQEAVKRKKEAWKDRHIHKDEESKCKYKEANKKAKVAVAQAKRGASENIYRKLETNEGINMVYRIAKQRDRATKDVQKIRMVKDAAGTVLINEEGVLKRWKDYFEELMNVENAMESREEEPPLINSSVHDITRDEVKTALKKMKKGKALGPDNIPIEAWLTLGDLAIGYLTSLFNNLLAGENIPKEWRMSTLIPIYKNKGDVQDCGNYRGIKLMSHTMKLWERVVEARLRNCCSISHEQFGFMPGKSTIDAIFALRMLTEKYIEGQRQLNCVFIDLEKLMIEFQEQNCGIA